ncbi:MAG: hypothetical protein SPE01_11735 [Candidatus Spyradocola sp.]|nr:hypothetical protein [Candidatus Spyradocola sp.]
MKKWLKGLSVCAVVLQVLALVVFLVTVLLQRQFKHMMDYPDEIVSYFNFPVVQTVYLLLVTAVIGVICISTLVRGRSIWAEIMGIVMLTVVCTLFYRVGVMAETSLFVSPRGSSYLAAYSSLQMLTGAADNIARLASSLALVACGMSIAAKKLAPRA